MILNYSDKVEVLRLNKTPNKALSCLVLLIVSLRGVNFGFWSGLGCSAQNTIVFNSFHLLDSCNQSLK